MARPLDLSSLTSAERWVLASAAAGFANGFVPWWYRVLTADSSYTYNAGLTGLGVVAVAASAVTVITVLARAAIWPNPAPARDGIAYMALGFLAAAAIFAELVRSENTWYGMLAGLLLALTQASAGLRRRRERRAGWG